MNLDITQVVKKEEIERCFNFAEELYIKNAASDKQFGRIDIVRRKNDFIADHVIGKAAEFALSQFLNTHFGIQFKVDFDVWNNPLVHDEGHDLSVLYMDGQTYDLPIKVDVKGTRKHSQWLVVEKHKLTLFKTHVYVIVRFPQLPTGKAFENDPYSYKGEDWSAIIEGFALYKDLIAPSSGMGWFEFKKENRLYKPKILAPLKNEIYHISISQFHEKLSMLLQGYREQDTYIGPKLDAPFNFGLPLSWTRNSLSEWIFFADMLRRNATPKQPEREINPGTGYEKLGPNPLSSGDGDVHQIHKKVGTDQERIDYSMITKGIRAKHSLLTVLDQEGIRNNEAFLAENLKRGVKVLLFTDSVQIPESLAFFQPFRLLQLYPITAETSGRFTGHFIKDGNILEEDSLLISDLAEECPIFNKEQFDVEHADADAHLNVEAGAGTGKTTVMIDRIFFLIHTASIPVSEMTMITFTREAAQNMFHKLRNAFFQRYKATSSVRYLELMEELRFMRISTIHSFAKQLIRELGSELGFGQNVQIRNFRTERKQIIENQLNAKAEQWLNHHTIAEKFKEIPLYKMINILDNFWTELERKGLNSEEIAQINWGESDETSNDLHELFVQLLTNCEEEFSELKISENAVSLSDLTRQVELISRREGAFKSTTNRISYLFIDEFQDTDDAQIKLGARLVKALKIKLFVVGDIKQSIYRFRGADYTAFENLRSLMNKQNEKVESFTLRKNYRSAVSILKDMDKHFTKWGNVDYLTYRDSDRLIGMRESNEASVKIHSVNFERYEPEHKRYTLDLINQARESIKQPLEDKIALLVRTNAQAGRLKAWCDEAGINTQFEIGGTFFASSTVLDFAHLIEALLFGKNPTSLINLLNSPYSQRKVHWTALVPFDGDEEKLRTFLSSIEPFNGWDKIKENLRIKPVLSVIREILELSKPTMRYMQQQHKLLEKLRPEDPDNKVEAETRALQYHKNLSHLLNLLHQQFSEDFLSLYSLHSWLRLNMTFNRDEDEPKLDEEEKGSRIRIITVHKSKGLEFHTVILPFTDQDFRFERSELLLKKRNDTWNAGWKIKERNNIYSSKLYTDEITSGESIEVQREEARLLYVAMTRSEERLWIVRNKKYSNKDNWGNMLVMNGGDQ